ncbi:MAG: hypothetical protein PQJ60_08430 [Spirochaetales bacterium]|nr:hypothetical protein [Spirochaetales bacterium]
MKKILPLLIFSTLISPLFSLDIWINGEYSQSYTLAELEDYGKRNTPSMGSPSGGETTKELAVSLIVPLFEEVYRIEAYGGKNRIVLEEPEGLLESLSFVFTNENFYLSRGDYRFENPTRVDIWGNISQEDTLIAIYPKDDLLTEERLETFCLFHDLTFVAIPSENPARELTNRIYQKKPLPHLVIFPESSLPALKGKIGEKRDYYFSLTALFSERGQLRRPMDLENILASSSHSYSWNCYDYETFSLFSHFYEVLPENTGDSLKQALVLNRSLKEMGILQISSTPFNEETDFFLADTKDFSLESRLCFPDFLPPLFHYTCIASPRGKEEDLLSTKARDYLLSSPTQNILGWERNGLYPALNTLEYTHPADPCLILLNKYHDSALRLSYSDESVILMDNWQTLSRLAVNSALSIDKLIESSRREEEGVY